MRRGPKLKFQDDKELQEKINAYFAECDPHVIEENEIEDIKDKEGRLLEQIVVVRKKMSKQRPYTITGLALALDTTRNTLLDYQNPEHYDEEMPGDLVDEIIRTIKAGKERCHNFAEEKLFSGQPTGVIFNLKNNYENWVDKHEVDQTNRTPSEALDRVERENKNNVADKAREALENAKAQEGGSPPPGQVVATDQPVQDQGQAGADSTVPAEPSAAQTPS